MKISGWNLLDNLDNSKNVRNWINDNKSLIVSIVKSKDFVNLNIATYRGILYNISSDKYLFLTIPVSDKNLAISKVIEWMKNNSDISIKNKIFIGDIKDLILMHGTSEPYQIFNENSCFTNNYEIAKNYAYFFSVEIRKDNNLLPKIPYILYVKGKFKYTGEPDQYKLIGKGKIIKREKLGERRGLIL